MMKPPKKFILGVKAFLPPPARNSYSETSPGKGLNVKKDSWLKSRDYCQSWGSFLVGFIFQGAKRKVLQIWRQCALDLQVAVITQRGVWLFHWIVLRAVRDMWIPFPCGFAMANMPIVVQRPTTCLPTWTTGKLTLNVGMLMAAIVSMG